MIPFKPNYPHRELANSLRSLSIDSIEKAQSGHPGLPLGIADVITVLYRYFLRFHPEEPEWPNRDRFILSAGHGSALLYSLLHLLGYRGYGLDTLKTFRQKNSSAAGHPEYAPHNGIEMTTGPLGQGLATAVGIALSQKLLAARYDEDCYNYHTYVLAGDGCLMEGISYEAAALAGHLKLSHLVVIWDDNKVTIDGATNLSTSEDTLQRFQAAGWETLEVDAYNHRDIYEGLRKAHSAENPVIIAAHSKIGYGSPTKEGTSKVHGSPLGTLEIQATKNKLGVDQEEFSIPEKIRNEWLLIGKQYWSFYDSWQVIAHKKNALLALPLDREIEKHIDKQKKIFIKIKKPLATRKSSQEILKTLVPILPELIGGSADLTPSNLTQIDQEFIHREGFTGHYLHYGIREHAMGAIMNGLALSKFFVPYAGTFLCFSDYMRPAMRLAALMKIKVIYIMTHDSIGLGEDGPTHQPVEHLASLRAIPNMFVFRPADTVETLECWQLAINRQGPSVLALSRQTLPCQRLCYDEVNQSMQGAYILNKENYPLQVSLWATGSEVMLAKEVQEQLNTQRIGTRLISIPCLDLLKKQKKEYISALRGVTTVDSLPVLQVVVEAGVEQGWEWLSTDGLFFGVNNFGISAKAPEIYEHFGLTVENIVKNIRLVLKK